MLRNCLSFAILASCFFLIAGCSGGGTPAVATVTALTFSTNTVAFSSVPPGTAATPISVTLTNAGNTPINFTSIALGSPSPFTMTGTCSTATTLPAGVSCTLTFGFTPTSVGSFTGTVTISDNVPGTAQSIALTGSGTAVASPTLAFSPSALTFTATNVGTSSASQSVAITNNGNAALAISNIGLSGGTPSAFTQTNNCGTSVAANTTCSIYVTFTPTTTGSLASSVVVTDNAAGSPQSFAVSGTGVAPTASLSGNSLTFTTAPNVASAPQSITLTNTGGATLNISSITLGGTNASDFTKTTTCGTTLAPTANCTITVIFTPTTSTSYAATITIADDASGSPQTISLVGTGTGSSVTRTLYTFGIGYNLDVTPLYTLINSATKTIDMTMYELQDTKFSGYLVAACNNGVKVRVILSSSVKSNNTAAYNQLNAKFNTSGNNCSAVFSNTAFTNTHQKTITVDGTTTAILSLNLQTQYYTTTRDFALIENDPADIAAIQTTFNTDYAAGTLPGETQGASDFGYPPTSGDTSTIAAGDLIWSPTTAQPAMLGLINNAQSTLLIENEEMSAPNIVSALVTACQTRHVNVQIAMVEDSTKAPYSDYSSGFLTLQAAGCGVHVYPDTSNGLYIHAKAVVADYGLSTQSVYMGSINYSTASMTKNRELGIYITAPAIVTQINSVLAQDYSGGAVYSSK